MFSSNSTDVVSLYRACVTSFKVLFRSLRGSDSGALSTEARLRDDLGRLRVWGETAGAHRDRTSQVSLDHRLREASDIKRTVLKLLSSLNSALKEACIIASGQSPRTITTDEPRSSASSEYELSSSESEPEEVSRTTEFEERLKDIAHAITCLYRFSIAIKNPAPRDRLERCMAIDVSFYTQHDVEHLGYKFPGAPRYLLDRLARANTKRRQLLKYNEKHHTKVVGNTRKSRPDGQPGNQDVDEDVAPPLTADFDDFDHISSSVAYSGAVSSTMETSASTVRQYRDPDISEVRSEGDYSCTSYASSSTNDPEALRVPLPPEPDNAFDEVPFLCPYCFSITAVDGRKSWARHVFGDIRPYVCTFENCTRPDYLFGSRHEWFEHERQIHRREWFCHACQIPFSLRTEFQQHLLLNHSELFSSSELQIVVDRAERAIELPQTCHLCSEQHLSDSLQRHLGRHLQQIALFILPGSIHEDTGSDSDRISDGFQHFEAYDIQHISNKFPDAQEYLVRRFGQANTRRRQRVKTLERHTKLRKDDIDAIIGVEGLMAGTFEDPPGSKEGSGGTALVLSDDLPPVSSSPGGVGSQASSESSDTNYAHHVVLPPLSVHDAFTGTPFQCPFCALVVTFSRRGSWEKHVFRDLKPYLCTFEDCQKPGRLFSSRRKWFEHESEVHHRKFDSQHEICNFCLAEIPPSKFRRHLEQHMEQIALFVWPIQVNEEDGRGSVWSNGVEVYSRVDTPWGKPGGGF